VITGPPTRPSESSGDSRRPRRRQSAASGFSVESSPPTAATASGRTDGAARPVLSHPPRNAYPGIERSEHVRGSRPPLRPPALDLCAPLSPEEDRQIFEGPNSRHVLLRFAGEQPTDCPGRKEWPERCKLGDYENVVVSATALNGLGGRAIEINVARAAALTPLLLSWRRRCTDMSWVDVPCRCESVLLWVQ